MLNNTHCIEKKPVRINVILPGQVDELLERRARAERRSKSAHVAWLIERDVERSEQAVPAVLEAQGA